MTTLPECGGKEDIDRFVAKLAAITRRRQAESKVLRSCSVISKVYCGHSLPGGGPVSAATGTRAKRVRFHAAGVTSCPTLTTMASREWGEKLSDWATEMKSPEFQENCEQGTCFVS